MLKLRYKNIFVYLCLTIILFVLCTSAFAEDGKDEDYVDVYNRFTLEVIPSDLFCGIQGGQINLKLNIDNIWIKNIIKVHVKIETEKKQESDIEVSILKDKSGSVDIIADFSPKDLDNDVRILVYTFYDGEIAGFVHEAVVGYYIKIQSIEKPIVIEYSMTPIEEKYDVEQNILMDVEIINYTNQNIENVVTKYIIYKDNKEIESVLNNLGTLEGEAIETFLFDHVFKENQLGDITLQLITSYDYLGRSYEILSTKRRLHVENLPGSPVKTTPTPAPTKVPEATIEPNAAATAEVLAMVPESNVSKISVQLLETILLIIALAIVIIIIAIIATLVKTFSKKKPKRGKNNGDEDK